MLRPVASVSITDLVIRYGDRTAVDGLSMQAPTAAVTALVGPNGAGKTSTVEACVGLRRPASGSIELLGTSVPGTPREMSQLHSRVGVMLQDGGLYATARPLPMLQHIASLYPNPEAPEVLLEAVGIDPSTRTPLRRMSGGEQRRVAAAAALIGRPELVFLDEPTTGLDPIARRAFHDLLGTYVADGLSVVLTTHLMDDVERLADRVVVVAAGRVVRAGTVEDLTGAEDSMRFQGPMHLDTADLLAALPDQARVEETTPGHYRVSGSLDPLALSTVTAWCGQHRVATRDIRLGRPSLEDAVVDLVGDL